MKIKKEYIILAVIIIASVLYLVLRSDSKVNYKIPRFSPVTEEAVTAITLTGPEETVELKKNGETWIIEPEGYRASEKEINNLLSKGVDLSIQDLISSREDYDRYELDDTKAVKVSLSTEAGVAKEFLLGKSSSSGVYSYIRLIDKKGIYSVRGNLPPVFTPSLEKWRDHQVLDFNPDETEGIELSGRGKSITFTRAKMGEEEAPAWSRDGENKAEDDEEIQNQLRELSRLKATKFLADRDSGQPQVTVIVTTPSGVHDLMIFDKEEKGYRARSSYTEGDFLIPLYGGDKIFELMGETSS